MDANTVGLMSIFILACQKDTVCSFWNRNRDGSEDRPGSWVRNVRTSLTVVTSCHLGFIIRVIGTVLCIGHCVTTGRKTIFHREMLHPCVGKLGMLLV